MKNRTSTHPLDFSRFHYAWFFAVPDLSAPLIEGEIDFESTQTAIKRRVDIYNSEYDTIPPANR